METKQVLKKVRKIEIKTRQLVEGLLQGAYHSIFKGRGIEFSEVREYVPGDDVRTIDWNVTARMNTPYVKEFIEERDLTAMILFDVSGSSEFGSEKAKKWAAVELAASLMFAAMHNNDRVGLVLFTDKVERFIPPRKGRKHVLRLIREMITHEPQSRMTDIKTSIEFVSKVMKKKSIVFVISDFFSEGDYSKQLRMLKNKHDVIAVNLNDLRETEIPTDIGYIQLEDEETGEQILVDTSDPEFQQNYSQLIGEHNGALQQMFKRLKIDSIDLKSHEPFEIPLKRFFAMRTKKVIR
ncbi:DUF58 domain-containing protein [Candidatus Woesearchaeota archaeon]|nr:DUF58 domain-containing protein [Candidatus Woesearchaeota archaeon]